MRSNLCGATAHCPAPCANTYSGRAIQQRRANTPILQPRSRRSVRSLSGGAACTRVFTTHALFAAGAQFVCSPPLHATKSVTARRAAPHSLSRCQSRRRPRARPWAPAAPFTRRRVQLQLLRMLRPTTSPRSPARRSFLRRVVVAACFRCSRAPAAEACALRGRAPVLPASTARAPPDSRHHAAPRVRVDAGSARPASSGAAAAPKPRRVPAFSHATPAVSRHLFARAASFSASS